MKLFAGLVSATAALFALAGCASESGNTTDRIGLGADTMLPKREGTVLIDGCVIDAWQRSTLAAPSTHRVLSEVTLLCLVPREDGTVGPRDPSAREALFQLISEIKGMGYRVNLGIAFTDESGQRYDGAQTRNFVANVIWRRKLVETLPILLNGADGVEIDLQQVPNDARPFITQLFQELQPAVRPKHLNVYVPPSVTVPSDLPGGDAISRTELANLVDRMRIMTLDYAEQDPGPTIDPGWAVDAVRVARNEFPRVDISMPLYGSDFGPRGRRSITYNDARAVAVIAGAPINRGPTGAPFISYSSFGGEPHQLWFDDAESTGIALGAWTYETLPQDVGIFYYGLGAEDPALWDKLSARLP